MTRFGAEVLKEKEVRFRLWAPAAATVEVCFHDSCFAMERGEDGWLERTEPSARAGTLYRYRINGDLRERLARRCPAVCRKRCMHPRVLEVYLDGTLARAMGAGLAESLDHVAGAAAAFASVAVNPAGAARHARQTASLVARLPAALDRRGSSAGL